MTLRKETKSRSARTDGARFVIPSSSEDAKGAPDKSSGKRRQKVEIFFNFVDEVEFSYWQNP